MWARLFFCVLLVAESAASADLWSVTNPWAERSQDTEPPPRIKTYELPRFDAGHNHGDQHTQTQPLKTAPYVDGEGIFYATLNCWPEPSKFRLELDLETRYSMRGMYDTYEGVELGGYYVGIVARMPLYSATELSREREREYMRRTTTAQYVGDLMAALANRNHAIRELGLYSSLEARSQVRVAQGVALVDEQVQHLRKVAEVQQALIRAESELVQHRLSLVGQCDDRQADQLNAYIKRLTRLSREGDQ